MKDKGIWVKIMGSINLYGLRYYAKYGTDEYKEWIDGIAEIKKQIKENGFYRGDYCDKIYKEEDAIKDMFYSNFENWKTVRLIADNPYFAEKDMCVFIDSLDININGTEMKIGG